MCRASNHFHNPLKPFTSSRVSDQPLIDVVCTQFQSIQSNVTWGTRFVSPTERGPATGNPFDWDAARKSYLNALTLPGATEREAELARTFETLGHVMHLVQDLAVPAHARNNFNAHLGFSLARLFEDGFEQYVRRHPEVVDGAAPSPVDFVGRLLTRFWDADQFTGANPSSDTTQGLAEYANANFVSLNTILTEDLDPSDIYFFPYPRLDSTNAEALFGKDASVARLVRAEDGRVDTGLYLDKIGDGEVITNFLRAGYLTGDFIDRAPPGTPQRLVLQLDDEVHKGHAEKLVPKVLGYSKGLLDYFFRGRLDVDLVSDSTDPSVARITGTNASPDALVDGTLTLYTEDITTGTRSPVTAVDPTTISGVEPGGAVALARFPIPDTAERFVAVYQGTLGNEIKQPDQGNPGGVIGKVLGGVRVEAIVNDGTRWSLRTSKGVFDLTTTESGPLTVTQYEVVKWGDTDSALIARTPLSDPQPIMAVFSVPRRPGSSELAIAVGGTDVVLTPSTRVPFPTTTLLTTVTFTNPVVSRQHVVRVDATTTAVWVPAPSPNPDPDSIGSYEARGTTFSGFTPEIAYEQTLSFSQTFPVTLDLAHNFDIGTVFDPYSWELQDLTVDASGRLLGLIVVFLSQPQIPPATVPVFRLNRQTGAPEQFTTTTIRAFFPKQIAPLLWALVDLEQGTAVASTATPAVTINYQVVDDRAQQQVDNLVWMHFSTTFAGGPNAGTQDNGWAPIGRAFGTSGTVTEVTLPSTEEQSLTVDGWLRDDLRQAVIARGLGSLQPVNELIDFGATYTLCDANGACSGLVIHQLDGRVRDPGRLLQARRPRPVGGNQRLVFLALRFVEEVFGDTGDLLVWDPDLSRAQFIGEQLAVGDHFLGPATGSAALVSSDFFLTGESGTSLVRLDPTQSPTFFPDVDLTQTYMLLEPSYLYNTKDLRFHRAQPSLDRTALPATLAPVAGNRAEDYHAIRLGTP